METPAWVAEHWFELVQTVGIVAGLVFTAYAFRRDEKARRVGTMIATAERYWDIWQELYDHPNLFRVLEKTADLHAQPVSNEEWLFVKLLILHLDTVFRTMNEGMFVKLEGLERDVAEFFALPIPSVVWEKLKPFQSRDFVKFIESNRQGQ